ncbi:MAG: YihY/virulence factor BrkB family protein [Turneriella sp.]|nr:YihY/virulence factor BrkB family protein [Turneriella sp.]
MAKAKKPGIVGRTKDFILDTLSGDFDETVKFRKRLQTSIRFGIAAVNKFFDDDVLARAASISYAIVVSFVPTLVVVMMLGSRFINIEEYFEQLHNMVRMSGMQFDVQPYFNVIRDLLKNAGAIGGIGLLVLMFSATSVLRTTEESINRIWRVDRRRPIVQKIAGFMMVTIFGPILLGVGISSAQWVVRQFASPNINQVKVVGDTIQLLGDQHLFLVQNEKGKPFREKNILKLTDFTTENDAIVYDAESNKILPADTKEMYDQAPRATRKVLRDSVFSDYAKIGSREFITTENGILASSKDNGETYHLRKFYKTKGDFVQEVTFNRIQFINDKQGIIIGDDGLILRTRNGGNSWQPAYQPGVTGKLIEFAPIRPGSFVILGEENTALITEDAGETFKPYTELLQAVGTRKVTFKGLAIADRAGYVVGEEGVLLVTRDRGQTWKPMHMLPSMFFEDVAVAPDGTAVAVGYDGLIRYSEFLPDGSIQWHQGKSDSGVNFHAVRYYAKENRFVIGGDYYHLLAHQVTADKHPDGREFSIIQKAPFWRRLVSALGNVLIPFFVIFILFFLVYKIIPYTNVGFKAATVGAAVTSISWVIFLLLYKYYVLNFSKGTAALYGTLALVPLSLLLLYVSALIVLIGAEIAFFVQYPQLFRMDHQSTMAERQKRQLWYGLSLLHKLTDSFNKGKNDCSTDALISHCNGDQEEFKFITDRLIEKGYITQTDNHMWLLTMNPDLIQVGELVAALDPSDYSIPQYDARNPFMRSVRGYLDDLAATRGKVFKKVRFSDLMGGK